MKLKSSPPPDNPITRKGDVWVLGEHKLLCGDSTSKSDVDELVGDFVVDLVFTDPPYGMKKESDGITNDNLNYSDLLEFNKKWIALSFDKLKENGSWYCWGIDEPLMDIYSTILKPLIKSEKITFRNLITWDKGNGQGQNSERTRMYATADEKCLFIMSGVQGFNNNSDNYYEGFEPIRIYLCNEMEKCGGAKNWKKALGNQMGSHYFTKSQWAFPTAEAYEKLVAFAKNNGFDAFNKSHNKLKQEHDEMKQEFYKTRAYFDNTHDNMNNVWHFGKTTPTEREYTGGHATPKPIALCSRGIKSSSRIGETVLDLFGGSGSTLVACEQLGRRCLMMEFEGRYCDVIVDRFVNLVGSDNDVFLLRNGVKVPYSKIKN